MVERECFGKKQRTNKYTSYVAFGNGEEIYVGGLQNKPVILQAS